MIPMQTYVNQLKREIDDLEWKGELDKADQVKYTLMFAEEKLHRGELFEPNF